MFARYASAVATGTLVTIALLYAMQGLINLQPGAASEDRTRTIVDWIHLPRQAPPEAPPPPDFDKETLSKAPVPPTGRPRTTGGTGFHIPVGPIGPGPIATRPDRISDPDGPLIAIVRVSPTSPGPAQVKGLEGWVDVRFDVMTNGQVVNVDVIRSSHRVFEKPAIRAAQKFRFRAPVVNGVPRVAHDVDYRFRFEMND
jgi:protein TonB